MRKRWRAVCEVNPALVTPDKIEAAKESATSAEFWTKRGARQFAGIETFVSRLGWTVWRVERIREGDR